MSVDLDQVGAVVSEPNPCPLCGLPLYGWIMLPPRSAVASVGMALATPPGDERVIDRCESCGVALEHDREIDLSAEWEAVRRQVSPGTSEVAVPDRASLQAWIGTEGWAAIGIEPGSLMLTPSSLELLAQRNGCQLTRKRWPLWGRAQAWMWQTLLNGLTFHPNFAREVRSGRLRPAAGNRLRFAVDAVVTVLAAPLVALVSVPIEVGAAVVHRGGELVATARPSPDR